jgi:hypothetical protein
MKSIAVLSVLFVAQAAAKIGFGPCPTVPEYTWSQYSANSISATYAHKVLFSDSTLDTLLNAARNVIPQLPNFKCGDLYPQALYYATQDIYNGLFEGPSDGLYNKLLWFDPTSKTEVIYYCMDGSKVPGLFTMASTMGIPIPPQVGQIVSTINQVVQTLNFLNLQIRFEGVFVTSSTRSPSLSLLSSIAQKVQIPPGYSTGDTVDYYTGC